MATTYLLGPSRGRVHLLDAARADAGKRGRRGFALCGEWCSFAYSGGVNGMVTVCTECARIAGERGDSVERVEQGRLEL